MCRIIDDNKVLLHQNMRVIPREYLPPRPKCPPLFQPIQRVHNHSLSKNNIFKFESSNAPKNRYPLSMNNFKVKVCFIWEYLNLCF